MNKKIWALPLAVKIAALALVPVAFYLSFKDDGTPLLIMIALPLALIVVSKIVGLKVEGDKVYLFRYTAWREIDPNRIKGIGYLPGIIIITVEGDWFTSAAPAFGYEANEMILKIRELQTKINAIPAA